MRSGGRFFTEGGDPRTAGYAWPGMLDWMRRIGVTHPGLVALFVGGEPIGALGISWTKGRRPSPSDHRLVEALARQAAAGLRLVQLADEARESAVRRAQEKAAGARVAELARANDALHRGAASFMLQKDARDFLETALLDACANCGARSAGIFRHDERADTLQMAAFVTRGKSVNLEADPRMEMWRLPFPTKLATPSTLKALTRGEVVWFDNEEFHPGRWPSSVEWHRRMGHRIVGMVPMSASQTFLGFLGLCFAEPVPPTAARLEQARTLAGHAGLALQLARLTEDLRRETAALAAITERSRIARDLHDTLAQGFTGIIMQLGVAEDALDGKGGPADGELRHALARAEELARRSLAEARRSVAAMREEPFLPPGEAAPSSLEAALRAMLGFMTAGTRLRARLEADLALPRLPPRVEETLRRIAQEALTNSLRHAGPRATEFLLRLECRENHVALVARDNGCGLQARSARGPDEGFGLVGMRERAALAGGVMTLRSRPDEGVEIVVELPFPCDHDS